MSSIGISEGVYGILEEISQGCTKNYKISEGVAKKIMSSIVFQRGYMAY